MCRWHSFFKADVAEHRPLEVLVALIFLVAVVAGWFSDRSGRRGRSQGIFQRPVKTFEAHGLVVQEPKSKKYMLGPAIIELAGTKLAQDDLPQVSRRYLAQLSSETRETAHLATLYESEVLYLDKVDSPQPVRVAAHIGGRVPLHCTANGKFSSHTKLTMLSIGFCRRL